MNCKKFFEKLPRKFAKKTKLKNTNKYFMMNYQEKFMSYAINLAKKNIGITSPNPSVGCVIVHNNKIIATSTTSINGRPHAEKIAIEKIENKEILAESEIYISLEPCSHIGVSLPCCDEIIRNNFKKVIISVSDKDVRVNGEGIKKLKNASIEVEVGILEKEGKEVNKSFFHRCEKNKPFTTLKIATSLDGKIATKNHQSKWITSEQSRKFVHLLRAKNEAILIGAESVRKDNPSLNCRIAGMEKYSPQIFVLSNSDNFDKNLNIFNNSDKKPIFLAGDLKEILTKIANLGFNSLLVEGGGEVFSQFIAQNMFDEIIWIRSSKIMGNDSVAAIKEMNFLSLDEVQKNIERYKIKRSDQDLIEFYRKKEY
jgi:diaminohydroxyphosphoribosylaminopyrimidine deaminase/5-amino-6-(5-phosphoribosylamino)uracil reductase